jgi:hypothetical protein
MNKRIRNTLHRALKGVPPKYRGQEHQLAYRHTLARAKGEYTPCAVYYHSAELDDIPTGAVTTPWGYGVLAYTAPPKARWVSLTGSL